MEISDRQLIICGRWAVASDGLQWILQKRRNGVDKRTGKAQWDGVSFVRSTKDILARCMREKDCPPEVAQRLLAACGERFDEAPYGRATRTGDIVSCAPATEQHSRSSSAGKILSETLH
jgi:hypothetical protein